MALRNIFSQNQIAKNIKQIDDKDASKKQQTNEEQEPEAKAIEITTNRVDAEKILDAQANLAIQNKLILEMKGNLTDITNNNDIKNGIIEDIKRPIYNGGDAQTLIALFEKMIKSLNNGDFSTLLELIKNHSGMFEVTVLENNNGK